MAVIDRAVLDQLQQTTDAVFVAELIQTYVEDSVRLLAAMRQAIAESNPAELRRAAHSLKSNSANFGADDLASLCRELELRAAEGLLEGAADRLARIEDGYAEVERELRRW